MTTFCLRNNTWRIIVCQSTALLVSAIDYDKQVSFFFKLYPLRLYQPRGFVPSLGPFFGISVDMSAAASWDLGLVAGEVANAISPFHLCLFAVMALVMPLPGIRTDSLSLGNVIFRWCRLSPANPCSGNSCCPWRGVKPGTGHQGREQREHFKLASLTKPEFPEIMASVDLMLYKMKGKLKIIKPAY